tara:strand:+ start:1826 stop:2398 length:573 start_codon:yes stop_codon:yes gene_type:complete
MKKNRKKIDWKHIISVNGNIQGGKAFIRRELPKHLQDDELLIALTKIQQGLREKKYFEIQDEKYAKKIMKEERDKMIRRLDIAIGKYRIDRLDRIATAILRGIEEVFSGRNYEIRQLINGMYYMNYYGRDEMDKHSLNFNNKEEWKKINDKWVFEEDGYYGEGVYLSEDESGSESDSDSDSEFADVEEVE